VGVALSICTDAPYAATKILPPPERSCQQLRLVSAGSVVLAWDGLLRTGTYRI